MTALYRPILQISLNDKFTDLSRASVEPDAAYLDVLNEIAIVDQSFIDASRRYSSVVSIRSRRTWSSLARRWLEHRQSTWQFSSRYAITPGLEVQLWESAVLFLEERVVGRRLTQGKDNPSILPMFGGVTWVYAYETEPYPGVYEPSHAIDFELYWEPWKDTLVDGGADVYLPINDRKLQH